MQPRLELEEVQVTPTAAHAVMNQLMRGPACLRARTLAGVLDLEIDPPLGRVELVLDDVPRLLPATCGSEQGFGLGVHRARDRRQKRAVVPPKVMYVEKSISPENGTEPHLIDWS